MASQAANALKIAINQAREILGLIAWETVMAADANSKNRISRGITTSLLQGIASNDFSALPAQEAPHARASKPFAIPHEAFSAQEYLLRISCQLPAFVEIVVGAVFGKPRAVIHAHFRVPDADIRVRPNSQAAFLGIQPKNAGWVGSSQGRELVWADPAGMNGVRPKYWQPVADAGDAVGYLSENAFAELFPW